MTEHLQALHEEHMQGEVKIVRALDSQALFNLLKPYLDQGWQLTVFDETCAIIVRGVSTNE